MAKSAHALRVDEVQSLVAPFLNRRGFVQHKRVFRKTLDHGLMHLIEFGMAPSYSIYYGKFTVDVGVFIPEVYHVIYQQVSPKHVTIGHCEISRRLSALTKDENDQWWSSHDIGHAADDISTLLLRYGLPYLEQLSLREHIYAVWKASGNMMGFPPRGRLSIAIMLQYCGQRETAKALIQEELENNMDSPYEKFIRQIAQQCELLSPTSPNK